MSATEAEALDAGELQQLGLSCDPFVDCAEGLLFLGAERSETVEQIQHLARYTNAVLLICGPPGSGCTALRHFLVANMDQDVCLCQVEARLLVDDVALLSDIASGFDLPENCSADAVTEFCRQSSSAGRLNWLVVDDAGEMSAAELKLLLALVGNSDKCLHLIMFGAPHVEEYVRQQEQESNPLLVFRLPLLEKQETSEYIEYRLQVAGIRNMELFSEAELGLIAARGRGLPGQINHIARELLRKRLAAAVKQQAVFPKMHIALIVFTIAVLALLYLFRQDEGAMIDAGQASSAAALGGQRIDVLPSRRELNLPRAVEAIPLPEPAGVDLEGAISPTISAIVVDPSIESESFKDDPIELEPAHDDLTLNEPLALESPFGTARQQLTEDEQRLLVVADTGYFLQLMVGVDQAGVSQFRKGLPISASIYRRLRDGRLWYVVVAGPYPSIDAATEVAAKLPKQLRDAKPWRRPVQPVINEIREFAASE